MHQRAIPWQRLFAFALVATLLLASSASAIAKGNPKDIPGVMPPNKPAFGKTYEEWSVAWWQWIFSLPAIPPENHPLIDKTGAACAAGQQGDVWFLAGLLSLDELTQATRDCAIPSGKALFFPILNSASDNLDGDPSTTFNAQELTTFCRDGTHPASLLVEVDSVQLQAPTHYVIKPTWFTYTIPTEGNSIYDLFGIELPDGFPPDFPDPGAVSCGYYVMLSPLSAGAHTLHFAATASNGFQYDVTYNLDVAGTALVHAEGSSAGRAAAVAAPNDGQAKSNHKHKSRNGGQHRSNGKHRH
jgi:hypothetical protein